MNAIQKLVEYFKSMAEVPPMFIDGLLFVMMAFLTAIAMRLASDDAAKYIEPKTLWWLVTWLGASIQGLQAFKMYRSEGYARHRAKLELKDTDTQRIERRVAQPPSNTP